MRNALFTFTLTALSLSTAVWAQDGANSDDVRMSTEAESTEITRGYLKDEVVGFKPQAGVMVFDELGTDKVTSRFAGGFTLEANIAPLLNPNWSTLYFGPSTGFIYSHVGEPTSNFFGTNPSASLGNGGANLFLIPANLKIAFNMGNNFRIGAHGGGNVMYRSVASSIFLGDSSTIPGSVWRIFPNVGADAELGIGKYVALSLRPDWTITPGSDIFTGTLAVNFLLG